MRTLITVATVLLLLGTLVLPSVRAAPAAAESKDEKARRLHDKGLELYGQGQYAKAIAAYQQAYDLVPAAGILFNLAQAYRLHGDCAKALELFEKYVREKPNAANASVAREHIGTARRCVRDKADEQEASKPSPFEPSPETTPNNRANPVESESIDGSVVRTSSVSGGTRRLGIGLGAAGIVSLGIGVVFGLRARSAQSEIDDFFQAGGTWDDERRNLEARGRRANTRMIGFTAVGGAAVVAGGVIYALGMREKSDRDGQVAIQPARDGAMMVWSGSF